MRHKPGDRVGAIQKADRTTVYMFGYGVYDGDFPSAPFIDDTSFLIPTPRLTLDNGGQVWGRECWWGSEERVKAMIGDRKVVYVDPPRLANARGLRAGAAETGVAGSDNTDLLGHAPKEG